MTSATAGDALYIGDDQHFQALYADGKPFVFSRAQMAFLSALQKHKDVAHASFDSGLSEEWAKAFLKSPKFKAFVSSKLHEASVKNGVTIEWWYQFGKWATEGVRSFYEAVCDLCKTESVFNTYEVEAARLDTLAIQMNCPTCLQPIHPELKTEPFRPSREQIVAWQEFGARLVPKVERVHHEFSNETYHFATEESS